MSKPKECARYSNHSLLFLLLLQTPIGIFTEDCQLYHAGKILDCVNITTFPNGSYETVEMIKFHRNNFTELKPYIFMNHSFYNLEKAHLRHNYIQHIHPHAFDSMNQLTYLDLYGNNITILDNRSFSGLEFLKQLYLGQNQISVINEAILKPLLSLESLDLTFNRVVNFSANLFQHKNISELKLSGNPIQLPKDGPIFESDSLSKLSLRFCNLKELSPNAFKLLPELIYLDLSENSLKILPDNLLKPLVRLRSLDIGYNNIMHLDIDELPLGSHIDVLLCSRNPLEKIQNCSKIIREIKVGKEQHAENNPGEFLILNQTKPVKNKKMLKSSSVEQEINSGEYKINKLQFKLLIGLSIALMVVVIILLLQALYEKFQKKN